MTNNIEKMYELAGIDRFDYELAKYPDFTDTKQLELIKWVAINGEVCRIDATEKDKWFIENDFKTSECFADFSEALADLVCELWEYLTLEQREEIKRILK